MKLQSKWHRDSTNSRANNFCNILENNEKSIVQLMSSAQQPTIESNRIKLIPITKTIVFFGIHNIRLRGKTD